VIIPSTIDGLPVTSLGDSAFFGCISLTNVTIPNNVTSIGDNAFGGCTRLTSATIGNGVTSIGGYAFGGCTSLTSVTIGNGVTTIGGSAFAGCWGLTSITIPKSVTGIGGAAFEECYSLGGVYFQGNAVSLSWDVFYHTPATVYYLPGTTGWGTWAVLWNPLMPTSDVSFGVRTNRFGFTINGSSSPVVVVEACTNLANPTWSVVGANILTGGSSYFSDPQWTNYPARFYRLRSP